MEKEGKISDKFGQVWASLGKLGQVSTRQQIIKMGKKAEKIRKGKKIWVVTEKEEEKVGSRIRGRLSAN